MLTYYNENDPYCAEWLVELSRRRLVGCGTVDARSIRDVRDVHVAGHGRAHFFAGIGGWELALGLAGWPRELGVWTGSCPCQPFSVAGKGGGVDDERHLWPEFRRLIEQCKPPVVFGEQVASKLGREWLDGVRADLEKLGYAVGAADLCAAGVGAPHIRQRLYWVACSASYAKWYEQPKPCNGPAGRMGREQQSLPWARGWQGALRDFRVVDDGLSYGVAAVDAPRNAIVPQVAATFIRSFMEAVGIC